MARLLGDDDELRRISALTDGMGGGEGFYRSGPDTSVPMPVDTRPDRSIPMPDVRAGGSGGGLVDGGLRLDPLVVEYIKRKHGAAPAPSAPARTSIEDAIGPRPEDVTPERMSALRRGAADDEMWAGLGRAGSKIGSAIAGTNADTSYWDQLAAKANAPLEEAAKQKASVRDYMLKKYGLERDAEAKRLALENTLRDDQMAKDEATRKAGESQRDYDLRIKQAEETARHNKAMEAKPAGSFQPSYVIMPGADGTLYRVNTKSPDAPAQPVPGPDGKPLVKPPDAGKDANAPSAEDVRKFRQAANAKIELNGQTKEFRRLYKENGNSVAVTGPKAEAFDAIYNQIQIKVKDIGQLGQLTKGDQGIVNAIQGLNPTSLLTYAMDKFGTTDPVAAMDRLDEWAQNAIKSAEKAYLMPLDQLKQEALAPAGGGGDAKPITRTVNGVTKTWNEQKKAWE